MQNSYKIAVTGGIGSGKSTVCEIIKKLGFATLSCDEIYAELLKDADFLNILEKNFCGVLNANGLLNRKKLSNIVFSDSAKLEKLSALTHPAIMKKLLKSAEEVKGICFCEVPLLFEHGYEKLFDKVIVVTRDYTERVQAVSKRDNITQKEVENRINSQYDYENSDFAKYYVIHNNSNCEKLYEKTCAVMQSIIADINL